MSSPRIRTVSCRAVRSTRYAVTAPSGMQGRADQRADHAADQPSERRGDDYRGLRRFVVVVRRDSALRPLAPGRSRARAFALARALARAGIRAGARPRTLRFI